MKKIENAICEILDDDYCAREMDMVNSSIGEALDTVIRSASRYVRVQNTIRKKVESLKKSSDYPHNFKGQMVEDFEWVLSLLELNLRKGD